MKKKIIRLTECEFNKMILESVNNAIQCLLFEDKRTEQAKKRCKTLISSYYNNAEWLNETFDDLTENPKELSYLDYFYESFMNRFFHSSKMRSSSVMRLAPLFCRIALESGFCGQSPNLNKINRCVKILQYIYNEFITGKVDVSNIDINSSYDTLNNIFGVKVDELIKKENDKIKNKKYKRNTEYEIRGPIDFEESQYYGEFTCPDSEICYTQLKSTWNEYTSDNIYNVYVLLKKGWEDLDAIHDDESESAYDTYGLSMIFVIVDDSGELAYCNTRWNHEAVYDRGFSVDHAMNKAMISDLLGVNFNKYFIGNNKFSDKINNIKRRLKKGENPILVFDSVGNFSEGLCPISVSKKYNVVDTSWNFVLSKWYDYISDFKNGFAIVENNGMYNFLNKKTEIISNIWFHYVNNFKDGYAKVYNDNQQTNLLDENGNLFTDDWFSDIRPFIDGWALVKKNGLYNFINKNKKYISNKWFDDALEFKNGKTEVYLGGKRYFIDKYRNITH